jgi:hypothetical protein
MGRYKNNSAYATQDFYVLTADQLNEWGAKYHYLFWGKPAGDYYIDDKGVGVDDFFKE